MSKSDIDRATHLERGDAGGKWPDGLIAFRWSRQTGRVQAFLGLHASGLTLEQADQALEELGLCVAAVRAMEAKDA